MVFPLPSLRWRWECCWCAYAAPARQAWFAKATCHHQCLQQGAAWCSCTVPDPAVFSHLLCMNVSNRGGRRTSYLPPWSLLQEEHRGLISELILPLTPNAAEQLEIREFPPPEAPRLCLPAADQEPLQGAEGSRSKPTRWPAMLSQLWPGSGRRRRDGRKGCMTEAVAERGARVEVAQG